MANRNLWIPRIVGSILLVTTFFLAIAGGCAEKNQAIVPFIPPNYYNCLEVGPDAILTAYYSTTYGNYSVSCQSYNDTPFIFKKIVVDQTMLLHKDEDTFMVSTIKCTALQHGAVDKLKVGNVIDIVGMNRGPLPDNPGWLLMTDCIFLPADSIQLPAPGGATFTPGY